MKMLLARWVSPHYLTRVREQTVRPGLIFGQSAMVPRMADLFRCESILLRSHWVMVVMDVFTRRIIGFGVEHVPDSAAKKASASTVKKTRKR